MSEPNNSSSFPRGQPEGSIHPPVMILLFFSRSVSPSIPAPGSSPSGAPMEVNQMGTQGEKQKQKVGHTASLTLVY